MSQRATEPSVDLGELYATRRPRPANPAGRWAQQPALFPPPARRPTTWTHAVTRAYHYFDVHHAPDLQDGRTTRRRIMRPARVEVLTTGTTVDVVWIHGPSVRRDGTLGAIQTRTCRTTLDPGQPDPPWLAALLAEHGLTFPRTADPELPHSSAARLTA